MNNGQPPYGDPSAWGQQGNQADPAQYPVQPNPYAPQGYFPQNGQQSYGQQQGYPQPFAPVQTNGQQQGYFQPSAPVQTYGQQQGYFQPFAPVQTYGQQQHPQQQVYPQQNWQPYDNAAQQNSGQPMDYGYVQQSGSQPYYEQQAYVQQPEGQPQQPTYPQFNQMGQQVQQSYGNGYSGYYSQPQPKKFEIPFDVIGKVILFGVLPALFILAMIFSAPALKWVFLAGAVGGIILMWMREIVSPNMRLTMSLVLGVMAVVSLVGALGGAPQDTQKVPGNERQNSNISQQQGNNVNRQPQNPTTPTVEPVLTPAPQDAHDDAVEQLKSFFHHWNTNNNEGMLARTAPSWRASVDDPAHALFVLLSIRTPKDDCEVTHITGTEEDAIRTATVKVTIDRKDGRAKLDRYVFKVIMKKEDGIWYVDPQSLASNEKETATSTVATANNTPTQPPLYTGSPSTVLYYNAQGGKKYHLDPDCPDVGKKYKPMTSFMYTDLDKAPYKDLYPCQRCGAPIPDDG